MIEARHPLEPPKSSIRYFFRLDSSDERLRVGTHLDFGNLGRLGSSETPRGRFSKLPMWDKIRKEYWALIFLIIAKKTSPKIRVVTILPHLIGIRPEFHNGTREKLQRIRKREEREMEAKETNRNLIFIYTKR